jgi:hypothetical protein
MSPLLTCGWYLLRLGTPLRQPARWCAEAITSRIR